MPETDPNVYPVLTLRDVLTAEELAGNPYAGDIILNHRLRMLPPLGRWFAQMPRKQQRAYVLAAIDYTTNAALGALGLPSVLATLLEQAYASPPRLTSAPRKQPTTSTSPSSARSSPPSATPARTS